MPQDPNLYGRPAPKRQRKEMDLSSSLSFAAQMSSLLQKPSQPSSSTSTSSSGRPRPSKTAETFKSKRSNTSDASTSTNNNRTRGATATATSKKDKLRLRSPTGTYDTERDREAARLNMEEKARRYAAMKRGDYVPSGNDDRAPLVDFDRKWAEKHLDADGNRIGDASSSSSSSDEEDDNNDTELVTYTDEFGRARRVTVAQARRLEQRARSGLAAAADLVDMSARPAAPQALIFGDAIQAEAFAASDAEAMETLARKRDRSATPPPATHYDARREMRGRGVGFYSFTAGDEEARRREMEGLEAERRETERVRAEREDKLRARREEAERRRREIEERRKEVGERRAKKLAESFLDGLGMDLGVPGAAGTGAAADPTADGQKNGDSKSPDSPLPYSASRLGDGAETDGKK